ncbi:hypothetical protein F4558_004607 [Micromonospora profundi]|nr:hypothetical protein [Micromonospora profundi]
MPAHSAHSVEVLIVAKPFDIRLRTRTGTP